MIVELFFVAAAWAETRIDAGEYLARAASCRECHTPAGAPEYAGGLALPTEFGVFFSPNITPDPETGIGRWNEKNFLRALRAGRSPAGGYYYPTFPYRSFSKMTDIDIENIFLYLRLLPPVKKFNRPNQLSIVFDQRWLMFAWQELFFRAPSTIVLENIKMAEGPFTPDPQKSAMWNRGAYLVEAVLHCTECHTPRNFLGAPDPKQWMAGSDLLFSGLAPPNITPDPVTGTNWSREEWNTFLSSGVNPAGKSPGVEMALEVRAASGLTRADRDAVVEYLLSLAPVRRYSKERVAQ